MKKYIITIIFIILALIVGILIGKNINSVKYDGDYTNIIKTSSSNGVTASVVGTFDKNDICINFRIQYIFPDEETAKEQYDNWKRSETLTCLKIDSSTVIFNDTTKVGETKKDIINSLSLEGLTEF